MSGLISSFQDTNVVPCRRSVVFLSRAVGLCVTFFLLFSGKHYAHCFGCITEKPAAMGLGLIQGNNLITFTHTAYYGAALPCECVFLRSCFFAVLHWNKTRIKINRFDKCCVRWIYSTTRRGNPTRNCQFLAWCACDVNRPNLGKGNKTICV